jgi:hypothetical protein
VVKVGIIQNVVYDPLDDSGGVPAAKWHTFHCQSWLPQKPTRRLAWGGRLCRRESGESRCASQS